MSNIKYRISNKPFARFDIWNLRFDILIGTFILDRITKLLAIHYLEPLTNPAPTFGLRLFLNPTFAFGIPGGNRLAIILSTLVVLALIWVVVVEYKRKQSHYQLLVTNYSIILAGAFGNLLDRVVRGGTVDWLVAGPWTVNVADVSILLGVLFIFIKVKTKNEKVKTTTEK